MSIAVKRPLHSFDNDSIRPGPVGSVGDVVGSIRLKHSAPELNLRFRKLDPSDGSNVQDGLKTSFTSNGLQARVIDSNWGGRRAFKTSHGWYLQDMRAEDRLHEPYLNSTPQYSWRNKIATTYEAKRTGNLFLPLPGGYNPSPGEIARGQILPVVTNVEGEFVQEHEFKQPYQVGGYLREDIQSGFIEPMRPTSRKAFPPKFR